RRVAERRRNDEDLGRALRDIVDADLVGRTELCRPERERDARPCQHYVLERPTCELELIHPRQPLWPLHRGGLPPWKRCSRTGVTRVVTGGVFRKTSPAVPTVTPPANAAALAAFASSSTFAGKHSSPKSFCQASIASWTVSAA